MELSDFEIVSSEIDKPLVINNRFKILAIPVYKDYNELYKQIKEWVAA
jgi:hypothetical protein